MGLTQLCTQWYNQKDKKAKNRTLQIVHISSLIIAGVSITCFFQKKNIFLDQYSNEKEYLAVIALVSSLVFLTTFQPKLTKKINKHMPSTREMTNLMNLNNATNFLNNN